MMGVRCKKVSWAGISLSMVTVASIAAWLEEFAPARLAEDWDNVGLLVGDAQSQVTRVMTCLTITSQSADEAIATGAQLIVTHHPLPFRPLKRITADNPSGKLLLNLIRAGVAIYSPHTAFDSTLHGINQQLAAGLGLQNVQILKPIAGDPQALGAGRCGQLSAACEFADLAIRVKTFLKLSWLQVVARPGARSQNLAVACGSAGEFLPLAVAAGCDTLLTGEVTFHTCLEAEARGISLILAGHYASERFAVESLAEKLAGEFPAISIWPSRNEADPLCVC